MIKRLFMILGLLVAGASFTPGALPMIEDALGLSGPPMLGGTRKFGAPSQQQAVPQPKAGTTASATASHGVPQSPREGNPEPVGQPAGEPAPAIAIEAGSVLGVLTAIQSHAEHAGLVCHTIETSSRHASDEQDLEGQASARWHLAGAGTPERLVAFVAELEQDPGLTAIDSVQAKAFDESRLAFEVDLVIDAPDEEL